MIEDIIKLTKSSLEYKKNQKALVLYNVFDSLYEVMQKMDLVANHYLALRFDEEHLQNSSFKSPEEKWRNFLNEDLEDLRKAIRNYLIDIWSIKITEGLSFINTIFKSNQYAVLIDNYKLRVEEFDLVIQGIDIDKSFEENLFSKKVISLKSYEKRVNLKLVIKKEIKEIKTELKKLKEHIIQNHTIDELLERVDYERVI